MLFRLLVHRLPPDYCTISPLTAPYISLPGCVESWGVLFDGPDTVVDPTIALKEDTCLGSTSFLSKVPADSPDHEQALKGALDFTLRLGHNMANGYGSILWSGLYNGSGGMFGGQQYHPPSLCDNEWRKLS